jgi:hypothetical protein
MSSISTRLTKWFSSPADRAGLQALGVSLIPAVAGALKLTGPARTAALVSAGTLAAYGLARIIFPDNAALKTDVVKQDIETEGTDLLNAFATKNPGAFAKALADAGKLASDLTAPAAPVASAQATPPSPTTST